MKQKTYDYILRYCVEPGLCEEERLDTLVDFCRESHTQEVMFFILAEELNTGHATLEELEPWLEVVKKGKKRMDEIGVRTSINPWMTLLHCDRGRKLKPGQNFRLMVDPYGREATACACPLDEDWLDNLCRCYAKYAELSPNVLWIEDDFRLHNHAPLVWGGCFCDEHMKLYSERAGKKLTREEFIKGICAPGEVHPYRKIWLDVSRETMLHLADRVAKSVFAVNPDIRMGLMTSDPATHCAEGRDWYALMERLTGNKRPCVRIHLPAYSEPTSSEYGANFQLISRLTKALLPPDIEIYPELENFPDTRFTKSCSFTGFQVETSAQIAAAGITMNIYDMMGNGILPGEKYQHMLAETLPFMNMTRSFDLAQAKNEGIEVLINPNASYTLESLNPTSIFGLYPRERNFASLLTMFSVTNCYQTAKPAPGAFIAVSGQYFAALSDEEIAILLNEHPAILDGEAVLVLAKRGLLGLIGAKSVTVLPSNSGIASYEEVANGCRYNGITRARLTMQNDSGDCVLIDYNENAEVEIMTEARSPEGKPVSPVMTIVNGKTVLLPYANYPSSWGTHRTSIRCELIQDAIARVDGCTPTYAINTPSLHIYQYATGTRRVLALVNTSSDSYDQLALRLGDDLSPNAVITLWSKSALLGRAPHSLLQGSTLVLNESLSPMETIFLTIE